MPVSFCPYLRFNKLINKSPITDIIAKSKIKILKFKLVVRLKFPRVKFKYKLEKAIEKINQTKKPSHVFPGLIFSANLNFPNNLPIKYAPISEEQTIIIKNKKRYCPPS